MAESITSLPNRKAVITRKVVILGGALAGAIVVAVALKKFAPAEVVVETIAEAAS